MLAWWLELDDCLNSDSIWLKYFRSLDTSSTTSSRIITLWFISSFIKYRMGKIQRSSIVTNTENLDLINKTFLYLAFYCTFIHSLYYATGTDAVKINAFIRLYSEIELLSKHNFMWYVNLQLLKGTINCALPAPSSNL